MTAGTNALVEEQMDDEGDSSADDSEDILTVRRKDVLGNMAEVEAMAARYVNLSHPPCVSTPVTPLLSPCPTPCTSTNYTSSDHHCFLKHTQISKC